MVPAIGLVEAIARHVVRAGPRRLEAGLELPVDGASGDPEPEVSSVEGLVVFDVVGTIGGDVAGLAHVDGGLLVDQGLALPIVGKYSLCNQFIATAS